MRVNPEKRAVHLLAVIVLAGAAAVCFRPLCSHPADLLVGPQRAGQNDVTSNILAFRWYHGVYLLRSTPSLSWNPLSLGGTPWLGNPQTAMFYPPNWLYALVDSRLAVSWLMVAHHWLAGWGTYLLCRRYGLGWPAGAFAGIVFMAAPYYVANTGEGHYNPVCLIAWVPWAFLCVERLRAGQRGGVVGTALVLTLAFFCGHVQELFYLVLLLTGFLAVDVVQRLWVRRSPMEGREQSEGDTIPTPRTTESDPSLALRVSVGGHLPSASRIVVCWVAVGLAVAGLTAVELLPNWVYSRQSVRVSGLTLDHIRPMCLQPLSVLQLLDPFVTGGPADYRGPGEFYWEVVCYFGVVPLVFAVAGVCLGYRRYPAVRFGVLWLAALLFALGDQTPWFPLLYRCVPGVSLFRAPARALFFCSFFTAVLAGVAFDSLLASAEAAKARWRRLALIAAGLALSAGAGLWLWQHSGSGDALAGAMSGHAASWASALCVLNVPRVLVWTLGGLGALWLLTLSGRWRTAAVAFGLAICGGELAWHAGQVLRTIPQGSIRRENPIVASLRPQLGLQRVLAAQGLISDREAWQAGVHKVQGYDPVPLARFGLYAAAAAPRQNAALAFAGFEELNVVTARKPLLDLLGVRYAVLEGPPQRELPGWKLWRTGRLPPEFTMRGGQTQYRSYSIYENVSVLPRAFVLGQTKTLPRLQDGIASLAGLDPRQKILVERDVLPAGPRQAFRPARIVDYSPASVTIEAQLEAPGYLVLTDTHYPGWAATVDGRPGPVVPADLLFRAVPLEPGRHVVEFRYVPPGAKTGGLASLMTVLILVVSMRRSRKHDPARATQEPHG